MFLMKRLESSRATEQASMACLPGAPHPSSQACEPIGLNRSLSAA
jgi:hypothetical protein